MCALGRGARRGADRSKYAPASQQRLEGNPYASQMSLTRSMAERRAGALSGIMAGVIGVYADARALGGGSAFSGDRRRGCFSRGSALSSVALSIRFGRPSEACVAASAGIGEPASTVSAVDAVGEGGGLSILAAAPRRAIDRLFVSSTRIASTWARAERVCVPRPRDRRRKSRGQFGCAISDGVTRANPVCDQRICLCQSANLYLDVPLPSANPLHVLH